MANANCLQSPNQNCDALKNVSVQQSNDKNAFWAPFNEWVHCFCVVTFDLELGQAMEAIYPSHIQLSEHEKMNICYLAFPDSNSGCMGDTKFHIRLRVAPSNPNTMLRTEHEQFNRVCLPVQRADAGHYWGFVYFRQIKDNTLPRGYFQKSLVILSRLPFINLFYELIGLIAPHYFDEGEPVLETACYNIRHWPSLVAGHSYSLPILGIIYEIVIPKVTNNHQRVSSATTATPSSIAIANTTATAAAAENNNNDDDDDDLTVNASTVAGLNIFLSKQICVVQSLHETDIFNSLRPILSHVHLLWELVLTAEPIVVMATSPNDCSQMVQSLTGLIAPLAYCAESRPYFTIHDSEFREFTQPQNKRPPPIIVGVTNPFFSKTLNHWPHTIRLLTKTITTSTNVVGKLRKLMISSTSSASGSTATSTLHNLNSSSALDIAPGVYTQYKSYLQKDKKIIAKIVAGIRTRRPNNVQSSLLRRYLLELTQSFMIPLERYMASLMPLQKDISPFKAAPVPRQFKQDDFLSTLDFTGPQLTTAAKGDWSGLYKRFFRSPNFQGWYETRYAELSSTLVILQLEALSEADLDKWSEGRHEIEIVDMIIKLRVRLEPQNKFNCAQHNAICLRKATRDQLLQQLENLKKRLPDDLKSIIELAA